MVTNQPFTFFIESVKNIKEASYILPSNKGLAKSMVDMIEPSVDPSHIVLELGGGTGSITQQLVQKGFTNIVSIEFNKNHYEYLKERYANNYNVRILNENAFDIENIIEKCSLYSVSTIISTLPMLLPSEKVRNNFFAVIPKILGCNGQYVTYSLSKKIHKIINKTSELSLVQQKTVWYMGFIPFRAFKFTVI